MARFRGTFIALVAVLAVIGVTASGAVAAGEPERHVVNASEIQARIDQQAGTDAANRQAIQLVLQRPDVREIAGRAGLDVERASATVAVLSGPELQTLATRAAEINAGVGGSGQIVISVTALIIILLIIILLTD